MERYRRPKVEPVTSGRIAKMRLEQVLTTDFLECSRDQADLLQKEITEILSRYLNLNDIQQIQLKLIQKRKQGVSYVKTIQIKGL